MEIKRTIKETSIDTGAFFIVTLISSCIQNYDANFLTNVLIASFISIGFFVLNLKQSGIKISEDGILVKRFIIGRKFIPFSDISYVRLGEEHHEYYRDLELYLKTHKILKFPVKYLITEKLIEILGQRCIDNHVNFIDMSSNVNYE